MDKVDEFVARYEANFGYFPSQKGGKGKEVMAVWRQWIIPITPELIDKTFKVLEQHRAHMGRNFKPTLEEFKRAHREAQGRVSTTGGAQRNAERLMDRPLFDFKKEGYPKIREAMLIELPRETIKRFSECWNQIMNFEITGEEMKAIQEKERWFFPEWGDYDQKEKANLCRRWGIPMPKEEELPF